VAERRRRGADVAARGLWLGWVSGLGDHGAAGRRPTATLAQLDVGAGARAPRRPRQRRGDGHGLSLRL